MDLRFGIHQLGILITMLVILKIGRLAKVEIAMKCSRVSGCLPIRLRFASVQ